MEIEEVAKDNRKPFCAEPIHRSSDCSLISTQNCFFGLGLPGEVARTPRPFFQALYRAFIDTDASCSRLILACLPATVKLVALDAKMTF